MAAEDPAAIRRVLDWPIAYFNEEQEAEARAALDALVAENQRLRAIVEIVAARRARFRHDVVRSEEEQKLDALLGALDGTP